jgi:hypothetical protein
MLRNVVLSRAQVQVADIDEPSPGQNLKPSCKSGLELDNEGMVWNKKTRQRIINRDWSTQGIESH